MIEHCAGRVAAGRGVKIDGICAGFAAYPSLVIICFVLNFSPI
jgi:hypothetical protein